MYMNVEEEKQTIVVHM